MQKQYIIGGALAIFVLIAISYLLMGDTAQPVATPEPAPAAVVAQIATSTYATTSFSIVYPASFTLSDTYAYTQANPKKPIHGVKFTIPMEVATGTNLAAADTGVSIEQLPRAKKCTGDIYLADDVRPVELTDNGITYSVATTSSAGAGNFYEEAVFAISGSSPCTAVRYFIHSMNIGNFEPGTVREFDKPALIASFDTIRKALTLIPQPAQQ